MIKVNHSLNFVTEFDENHPVAQRFLQLDSYSQIAMLEGMLKELIVPAIQPTIDEITTDSLYGLALSKKSLGILSNTFSGILFSFIFIVRLPLPLLICKYSRSLFPATRTKKVVLNFVSLNSLIFA